MTKPRMRDRVRCLERVKARDLKPHPQNWRRHPENQRDVLTGLLDEVGFAGTILAYEDPEWGMTIIDGHLRQETVTPATEVPVVVLDVTREEAQIILATFDPLSALAEVDQDSLAKLLAEVSTNSDVVGEFLRQLSDEVPDFEPTAIDDQSRLDERSPVTCPACGHVFTT